MQIDKSASLCGCLEVLYDPLSIVNKDRSVQVSEVLKATTSDDKSARVVG